MGNRIGIREEDKNPWERRSPLVPSDVAHLVGEGVEVWVQSSKRRAFSDEEFARAGAKVVSDVGPCEFVLGVKEMPDSFFRPGGGYAFFSHTIKGQPHNMGMLRTLVEKGATLLDYEMIRDEEDRRLIFFGRYAGLAGMADALWALGRRLEAQGMKTSFLELKPAHQAGDLRALKEEIQGLGERIAREGIPGGIAPLVVGITGYGHVSQGAQEILNLLPLVEVTPSELPRFVRENPGLGDKVVKVVFKEEDLVVPREEGASFDLREYYDHPERYRPIFPSYLPYLTLLVNAIFWTPKYPRLAAREDLAGLFRSGEVPKLRLVADISCDIDGPLACTVRETDSGDPVFVYDPTTGEAPSGFEGKGIAVLAVGNLPAEIPRDSSQGFSSALAPLVPFLASADLSGPLPAAGFPPELARAVILWKGEFTPAFRYMEGFLDGSRKGEE